jgi:hypothetical protein
VRDIAAERQARGGWTGYRTDKHGRLQASTTSRTVPVTVFLSTPGRRGRLRAWLQRHPWLPQR